MSPQKNKKIIPVANYLRRLTSLRYLRYDSVYPWTMISNYQCLPVLGPFTMSPVTKLSQIVPNRFRTGSEQVQNRFRDFSGRNSGKE
jgi:hypothetical protein